MQDYDQSEHGYRNANYPRQDDPMPPVLLAEEYERKGSHPDQVHKAHDYQH